jgi:RNA polymerase sigma-70 factor (ECF subfamily)
MAIHVMAFPESTPSTRAGASMQDEDLGALVVRCAGGEADALTRLYELTSPWIYGLLRRRTSSVANADNAAVAVYSQVWRQASEYSGCRQSVLAWMTSIACVAAADTESREFVRCRTWHR